MFMWARTFDSINPMLRRTMKGRAAKGGGVRAITCGALCGGKAPNWSDEVALEAGAEVLMDCRVKPVAGSAGLTRGSGR